MLSRMAQPSMSLMVGDLSFLVIPGWSAENAAGLVPLRPYTLADHNGCDAAFAAILRQAALAGMSVTTVCRGFVVAFGKPPGAYAVDVRMAHACRLLADPGRSIADVAAELGWSDPFHLRRIFCANFGFISSGFRTQRMSELVR